MLCAPQVDLLPEIQQLPRIVPDPEQLLPEGLRLQVPPPPAPYRTSQHVCVGPYVCERAPKPRARHARAKQRTPCLAIAQRRR